MWDDIHTKGASSNDTLASITYHIHEVSIKKLIETRRQKKQNKRKKITCKQAKLPLTFSFVWGFTISMAQVQKL
jgi:hypothetical protein